MYSTNFIVTNKNVCLSLHYNDASSYLFVNGKEIVNFKVKDSGIVPYPLCLGNISKDFSLLNTTNTGLYGCIYDFRVDYKAITNDKIHDIHRYLMTCFSFNLSNVNLLECVSMNNQEYKIRTEIINLNTNEPTFYADSIKINRCKSSCNTINDSYAKICVPDQIKDTNVKVFNLTSRTNEIRHIKWHKASKCKCRLNDDKCRCECKE